VIEVSLVSMGIELVIDMSAINFDMTFVDFLKLRGRQFEFIIPKLKESNPNIIDLEFKSQTIILELK
jgi:hypothetical protein